MSKTKIFTGERLADDVGPDDEPPPPEVAVVDGEVIVDIRSPWISIITGKRRLYWQVTRLTLTHAEAGKLGADLLDCWSD